LDDMQRDRRMAVGAESVLAERLVGDKKEGDKKETPTVQATGDAVKDRARAVLAKAEAEQEEIDRAKPVLPDRPFVDRLFSFLFHPVAVGRWAGLTIAGYVTMMMTLEVLEMSSGGLGFQHLFAVFLVVLLMLIGTLFVFLVTTHGVAIVQDTANGADKIESWPGFGFADQIGEAFMVVNGVFLSFIPGFMIGEVLACAGSPQWVAFALGGVTMFPLFPVILLSMMTEDSPITPYSAEIWKSFGPRRRTWKRFYLMSLILAGSSLVCYFLMMTEVFLLGVLAAAIMTAVMMTYFRLMGRLAWALAEGEEKEAERR